MAQSTACSVWPRYKRQYSKVTLDSTGTGSCIFRNIEAQNLTLRIFPVFPFFWYSLFIYRYLILPVTLLLQQLIRNIRIADAGKKNTFCFGLKNIFVLFPIPIEDLNIAALECACEREGGRERVCMYCVHLCGETRLVVHTKGWESVWACMCVCHCVFPEGVSVHCVEYSLSEQ